LGQLRKEGRGRQEALDLLANDRAAVDYTTLNNIQHLAKAVQAGEPGADENLAAAARKREVELRQHRRVLPASEPLRFFCGVLRETFKVVAETHPIPPGRAWPLCRRFALAVFEAVGIQRDDFLTHADRLTQYLQTDVTTD
jgi:hypothetical protein